MALTIAGTAIPQAAMAQAAPAGQVEFDIPAQDLNKALLAFTDRAGLQIFYDLDKVAGRRSSAVRGRYAPMEALSQLLVGTGLTFRATGNRVTLEPAPQSADGAIQLGPVRVQGDTDGKPFLGRYAPPETATSYVPSYAARRSAAGTKTDTPIIETPQSISIVTREALDAQGAVNLTDALRYTSGIGTAAYQNGSGDSYDILTIRGFANTNSGLLRDGMRLNYNVFDAPSETYGLERIEVLKGPAGVLYGQSGPSGIINLVSKRPTTEPLHEIEVQGGTFNRFQLATDHGGAIDTKGTFSYRLTALVRDSGGWLDYGRNDRTYIAPAISWRPDDRTNLTVLGYYQNSKSSYYSGLPYSGTVLANPNGPIARDRYLGDSDFDYWNTDAFYVGYLFEHSFSDAVKFKSGLRYSESTLDYGYVYPTALQADNRTASRSVIRRHDDSDTIAADNNVQVRWNALGGEHLSMVGIDYGRSHYQRTRWFAAAPPIDVYNPVYGNLGTLAFGAARADNPIRYQQTGIYFQQQSKFADRIVVTLNGRQDWAETITTALSTGNKTKVKADAFTFRGGLTYLHPSGFAPYFSYTEAFEPASGSTWDDTPFKPTTGRQYELGIKFQPDGSDTLVTVAAYHLKQQNVSTPDPDQVNHPGAQVQTGEIRSKGIEIEAQSDVTENLRIRGAFTLVDAQVTKSTIPAQVGIHPVDTPSTMVSLWGDYTVHEGALAGLSFGLGGRYTSGTYDIPNRVKTEGRTLFDALIAYQVDHWRLAVNATNIFDKTYINSCYSFCWYGRPRSVDVSLRYNW
ncbi:TonB-dependent siderophore receptor [Sphingobium cloacae]|uniref:Secretin/TonB short N-terminal domain-containing protein n=1 Tax=Sphingobium cloacae TaxID=120107 RepID=A0A1E1F4A5_9SPHN|nr:TonB-dependent siderophore receptor [Sphingobium cloacae]BAV65346.1 hypothetical protein SCLO_1023060 [Sphingobium cloacae]